MKIFEQGKKVNFVDENNVLVGYDLSQDCCETADWYIADKVTKYECDWRKDKQPKKETPDVSDYRFDTDFFEKKHGGDLDDGNMVIFRLVAEGKSELYLHVFNSHNGYYGHGFQATIGGQKWREGTL